MPVDGLTLDICYHPEDAAFLEALRTMEGVRLISIDDSDEWLHMARVECMNQAVRAKLMADCF